jgi:hypothetical protein
MTFERHCPKDAFGTRALEGGLLNLLAGQMLGYFPELALATR